MKKRKLILSGLLSLSVAFSAVALNSAVFAQTLGGIVQADGITINGDVLVDGNTETDAYHEAKAGDAINYESTLEVKSIKEKIQSVEDDMVAKVGPLGQFLRENLDQLYLENTNSEFIATLDVKDSEVDLSKIMNEDGTYNVTLTDNPLFKISEGDGVTLFKYNKQEADGSIVEYTSLIVKMVLKKQYDKYIDLKNDLMNTQDVLKIETRGAMLKDTLKTGDKVQVVGSVDGTFSSTAGLTAIRAPFAFEWKAVQDPAGVDFEYKNEYNPNIFFTTIIKEDEKKDNVPPTTDEMKDDKKEEPKKEEPKKDMKKHAKGADTADNFGLETAVVTLGASAVVAALALRRKDRA